MFTNSYNYFKLLLVKFYFNCFVFFWFLAFTKNILLVTRDNFSLKMKQSRINVMLILFIPEFICLKDITKWIL